MLRRIFVIANTGWYLYNFRLSLMVALRDRGFEVVAVSPADEYVDRIESAGFAHRVVSMSRSGKRPMEEFKMLTDLAYLFRTEAPVAALSYTPKPNIYASLLGRWYGVPVIPNIAGLGRVFVERGMTQVLVKWLYARAFSRSQRVFFQNSEDLSLFVRAGIVKEEAARKLPGSGVDLNTFSPRLRVENSMGIVFLHASRLLWDKGIGEYVDAARKIKAKIPGARFLLLGFFDLDNPSGIPRQVVDEWVMEGVIEYLGSTDDVSKYLADVDCVVLPSVYREGVPRILLESASMAKPIITTDNVGCRDAVDDGVTGYICRPRDSSDLAEKMLHVACLPPEARAAMGMRGREKMQREFDESIVIRAYVDVLRDLLAVTSEAPRARN